MSFVIAAKCAPEDKILLSIAAAGLNAVEIFLSVKMLERPQEIAKTCLKYPFRYAVHAPNDGFAPGPLAEFCEAVGAEVLTFHDIFWEDEWREIIEKFGNLKTRLCVENLASVHDAAKFVRRFGFGRCFDVEHAQLEMLGIFETEFVNAMRMASHIHLTGYKVGTYDWHTHIHNDPAHGSYMLDLIEKSGYKGMVVSEARCCLQTPEEFIKLKKFYDSWLKKRRE